VNATLSSTPSLARTMPLLREPGCGRAVHSSLLVPRTWPGCVTFDAGRPSGIN